jgi:hypothetical protein
VSDAASPHNIEVRGSGPPAVRQQTVSSSDFHSSAVVIESSDTQQTVSSSDFHSSAVVIESSDTLGDSDAIEVASDIASEDVEIVSLSSLSDSEAVGASQSNHEQQPHMLLLELSAHTPALSVADLADAQTPRAEVTAAPSTTRTPGSVANTSRTSLRHPILLSSASSAHASPVALQETPSANMMRRTSEVSRMPSPPLYSQLVSAEIKHDSSHESDAQEAPIALTLAPLIAVIDLCDSSEIQSSEAKSSDSGSAELLRQLLSLPARSTSPTNHPVHVPAGLEVVDLAAQSSSTATSEGGGAGLNRFFESSSDENGAIRDVVESSTTS